MKKVIKKAVAKAPVKKTVAKKPMMKSGGAKRTLRKYQGDGPEGSEVGPGGGSAPTPVAATTTAAVTPNYGIMSRKDFRDVKQNAKRQQKIARINSGERADRIDNAIKLGTAVAETAANVTGTITNMAQSRQANQASKLANQRETLQQKKDFEKNGGSTKSSYRSGGAMKKLGCAQCGKAMKKGGVKKMAAGGSTTNKLNNARGFAKSPKGGGNQKLQIYGIPNAGMTGPNRNSQTETMKKGGSMKKYAKGGSTFGMLSVKAGVDNNPNATAADRIAGATKKAKFGATVKVQRSPKAGKVRSAGDQGYAAVGQREPGRVIKRTLSKKAAGGPIIDKLKAKLAERKVTKAIKKSVKSSGKIVK
jgi:hypothetical protein